MILITQTQCASFNTKNCNDKTNFEGTNIDKLTRIGWDQILKSPANTLDNSFSFTDHFGHEIWCTDMQTGITR